MVVAEPFQFDVVVGFEAERAEEILREVPALPGVFCLRGWREGDAPYLTRTADLRRRMRRLLNPPEEQSKRLNLRAKVARIGYSVTGSEFESNVVLYEATAEWFGYEEARRRLKLRTPYFLRIRMENAFPRVYVTNRLSRRGLGEMYGPFASRAAAERYCDAVLDLFKLRRCHEDLQPYPEHPGCVYGEMKKCLEPCKGACTAEEYRAEAEAVKAFFETRGESLLGVLEGERERASEAMEFEQAAALHKQWEKVKAAAGLADELVRPVEKLRVVVVQAASAKTAGARTAGAKTAGKAEERLDEASVFLLERGWLAGPERLSTLGVRAVKEQTSVGSSLFAQPLMLAAVPLAGEVEGSVDSPEERAARVLAALEARVKAGGTNEVGRMSDHLSLLRRWYYKPEKQRVGEVFLPREDGSWPVRRILRGAARMVLGEPGVMAETQREAAKGAKLRLEQEAGGAVGG